MLSFAPRLQHYSAIMKYISQPPLLLNVHMHNPTVSVRSWMDSLLAFFPGLQVSVPPASLIGWVAPIPAMQRHRWMTGATAVPPFLHPMVYQATEMCAPPPHRF